MDTVHECDRRTDRQTARITITKTVQRIASHGNNPMMLLEKTWRGAEVKTQFLQEKVEQTCELATVQTSNQMQYKRRT